MNTCVILIIVVLLAGFITVAVLFAECTVTHDVGDDSISARIRLVDHVSAHRTKPDVEKQAKNLITFDDVATAHDMFYWAECGTALGIYRDGDIIPGDEDVDVAVRSSDVKVLNKVIKELVDKHKFRVMRLDPLSIVRDDQYIDIDIIGPGLPCMVVDYSRPSCDEFNDIHKKFVIRKWRGRYIRVPDLIYYERLYGPTWHIPQKVKPHEL